MDGITVVRVIRQVHVLRYVNINQPDTVVPLVQQPLPPAPQRNNRCFNACALLIIYTIGIGSIVIGAIHLNDCPAEKRLPVGLVVFGGLLMISRLLNCVYDCRSICEEESSEDTPSGLVLLNVLFCLAEFGMFITVCCWAFSISPTTKPEEHNLKNYCDVGLYKTSFYGCILGLIFYAIPFFCGCCCLACGKK